MNQMSRLKLPPACYVFPMAGLGKGMFPYRVCWGGTVLAPRFTLHDTAAEYLAELIRGQREPEYAPAERRRAPGGVGSVVAI